MKLSASQLETADICIRKWWFQYWLKLPGLQKQSFAKGTVLHGVCERALKGKELFPNGWNIDPETKQPIEPAYAQIIKELVEKAITAGYIEPRPGSRVEEWFTLRIGQDDTIVGLKDHEIRPYRVEDHKTSKSRRWFKSTAALKKSLQMMIYGYDLLAKVRQVGQREPELIELVHNQFLLPDLDFTGEPKETPIVQQRIAEVTPKELDTFWEDVVLPLVDVVREASKVKDAWQFEDPKASACNAFGGCQFMSLCAGQETPLTYAKRIGNMQGKELKIKMANTLEDFMKARRAKTPPASAETPVNPPEETKPATAEAEASPDSPPPWWSQKCGRCAAQGSAPGFNLKKKSICQICAQVTKVDASDFEYSIGDDGAVLWWKKGTEAPVASMPAPETKAAGSKSLYTNEDLYKQLKAVKSVDDAMPLYERMVEVFGEDDSPDKEAFEEALEAKLVALSDEPKEPDPTPPEPVKEEPKPEPKPKAKKKEKVEPPPAPVVETDAAAHLFLNGPIILINCHAISGFEGMPVMLVENMLNDIEGYWDEEVWTRRGNVTKGFRADPKLIEQLAGKVVVQALPSPDGDNLISALVPFASMVIKGGGR